MSLLHQQHSHLFWCENHPNQPNPHDPFHSVHVCLFCCLLGLISRQRSWRINPVSQKLRIYATSLQLIWTQTVIFSWTMYFCCQNLTKQWQFRNFNYMFITVTMTTKITWLHPSLHFYTPHYPHIIIHGAIQRAPLAWSKCSYTSHNATV